MIDFYEQKFIYLFWKILLVQCLEINCMNGMIYHQKYQSFELFIIFIYKITILNYFFDDLKYIIRKDFSFFIKECLLIRNILIDKYDALLRVWKRERNKKRKRLIDIFNNILEKVTFFIFLQYSIYNIQWNQLGFLIAIIIQNIEQWRDYARIFISIVTYFFVDLYFNYKVFVLLFKDIY